MTVTDSLPIESHMSVVNVMLLMTLNDLQMSFQCFTYLYNYHV